MNDTIQRIAVGVMGAGSTEIVTQVIPPDPSTITEIGGLIVQIIITIVTLFGLFKKKKKD